MLEEEDHEGDRDERWTSGGVEKSENNRGRCKTGMTGDDLYATPTLGKRRNEEEKVGKYKTTTEEEGLVTSRWKEKEDSTTKQRK